MMKSVLSIVLVGVALVACSEKPQTADLKDNAPAWTGASDPYVVSGWKPGDKASWEDQLQARALHQNEYRRIGTSR